LTSSGNAVYYRIANSAPPSALIVSNTNMDDVKKAFDFALVHGHLSAPVSWNMAQYFYIYRVQTHRTVADSSLECSGSRTLTADCGAPLRIGGEVCRALPVALLTPRPGVLQQHCTRVGGRIAPVPEMPGCARPIAWLCSQWS